MEKVLFDSDFLFGSFNPADPHYQQALTMFAELIKLKPSIYIVNLVLYETATLISHRLDHKQAIKFFKDILTTDFTCIFIDEELSKKATQIFLKQSKKDTSFVDCANVAVMEKLKINKIFSFDKFYKDKLFT